MPGCLRIFRPSSNPKPATCSPKNVDRAAVFRQASIVNRLGFIFLLLSALATSRKHTGRYNPSRDPQHRRSSPGRLFCRETAWGKAAIVAGGEPRNTLTTGDTNLIGLPPTVKELDDFRTDKRPTPMAFAAVVDRLLASPRYGGRWAQHWLDVIRWAETVGFETNTERPQWHYRDWVIAAFNRDLPYDKFIRDQLADVTGADAALGFLVSVALQPGQIGRDEEAMRSASRMNSIIRTVSQTMLGLTIGCARCRSQVRSHSPEGLLRHAGRVRRPALWQPGCAAQRTILGQPRCPPRGQGAAVAN